MKNVKILFISRSSRTKITGMSISSDNIIRLLEQSKCDVINTPADDESQYLNKKYDNVNLIWFYEDTKFNLEKIMKLSKLYDNNVPIISNIQNTNTEKRKNDIYYMIDILINNNLNNIIFGVFTEESRDFLDKYKKYIFPIPKTIRKIDVVPKLYSERSGIFLGEYNKMLNPIITNNFNTYDMIKSLKTKFPEIELFAYKHYDLKPEHPKNVYNLNKNKAELAYIDDNINILNYNENLMDNINNYRIYISNVTNETFAMVPAEAQSTGMCIMYRHMPQSLTPHIYYSGYLWYNIPDLLNAVEFVYYNEDVWNSISRRSVKNYLANNVEDLCYMLRLQLEKIIINNQK